MASGDSGAGIVVLLIIGGIWAAQPDSAPADDPTFEDEIRGGETYTDFDTRRDSLLDTGAYAGDGCTVDCSGHEAGYEWAEEQDITDPGECDGNSWSFIEGCQSYANGEEPSLRLGGSSTASRGSQMVVGGPLNGTIMPGADGGMVIGGPLNGSILPGRDGGMVVGGPLNGTVVPGDEGGMVIGGPLNGSILPGREGGMIIGGPLNGEMVPGEE